MSMHSLFEINLQVQNLISFPYYAVLGDLGGSS